MERACKSQSEGNMKQENIGPVTERINHHQKELRRCLTPEGKSRQRAAITALKDLLRKYPELDRVQSYPKE